MFFALLRDWGEGLEGVIKPEVKQQGGEMRRILRIWGNLLLLVLLDDALTLGLRKIHNTDSKGGNELMS